MNKNLLIGIAIVVIVLIGGFIFWQMQNSTPKVPLPVQNFTATYTKDQVATHNSATSCWSIIDAKVYDLTNWIEKHPGGQQAILGMCGTDGTVAFRGQHDSANFQANILTAMQIGTLAQ